MIYIETLILLIVKIFSNSLILSLLKVIVVLDNILVYKAGSYFIIASLIINNNS